MLAGRECQGHFFHKTSKTPNKTDMGKRGPPPLPLEDTGEIYRGFKKQVRLTRNRWPVTKYAWTPDSNSPDPGRLLDGMKAVDRHLGAGAGPEAEASFEAEASPEAEASFEAEAHPEAEASFGAEAGPETEAGPVTEACLQILGTEGPDAPEGPEGSNKELVLREDSVSHGV